MDRFPDIIDIGRAQLGKNGTEMIMTEPVISRFTIPSKTLVPPVEVLCAPDVIVVIHNHIRRDWQRRSGTEYRRNLFP